MSQTEIKNLIDLYSKKLVQLKRANSLSSLKLPKLFHNNSYHNFIKRKLEKLNSLNSRNKYYSGEKRIKQDLSTLFNIRNVNDFLTSRISQVNNKKKIFTNSNIVNVNNSNNNTNSLNSLNNNLNNSNIKTSTSNNNGNYKNNNIVIKNLKIIKSNENDTDKQNNDHFFIKKKYYINRNNYNKDIYNLIHTDNFNYFFSKIYSTPKKESIKALNFDEQEKNENN